MKLYTTLTRLKMAMNGGALPPMTPVPVKVQGLIDPSFVEGLGGLQEHELKGIRCPICGEYHHLLRPHLNTSHRGAGGATAVLEAMELSPRTSLVSAAFRARRHLRDQKLKPGRFLDGKRPLKGKALTEIHRDRIGKAISVSKMTTHYRNLNDRCHAQLSNRLLDLEHALGHSPSIIEAQAKHGSKFTAQVIRLFGSWNNAKAQCGLQVHIHQLDPDAIYDAFRLFYQANGRLPTLGDAKGRLVAPPVPKYETVLKHLKATSWPLAMAQIAMVLGIDDERYLQAKSRGFAS